MIRAVRLTWGIGSFARFELGRIVDRLLGVTHQVRKARLGLVALTLFSLYWLALGTALFDEAGFERYCQVFDESALLVGLETVVILAP